MTANPTHALIVKLPLTGNGFGTADERARIAAFEAELRTAIANSPGAGEFDGNDFGGGECTLYMYGPSADDLLAVASPVLRKMTEFPGSFVRRRYGAPGAAQINTKLNELP